MITGEWRNLFLIDYETNTDYILKIREILSGRGWRRCAPCHWSRRTCQSVGAESSRMMQETHIPALSGTRRRSVSLSAIMSAQVHFGARARNGERNGGSEVAGGSGNPLHTSFPTSLPDGFASPRRHVLTLRRGTKNHHLRRHRDARVVRSQRSRNRSEKGLVVLDRGPGRVEA